MPEINKYTTHTSYNETQPIITQAHNNKTTLDEFINTVNNNGNNTLLTNLKNILIISIIYYF